MRVCWFFSVNIYEDQEISFQTFFVWAILLIVHTGNCSPLRRNLLRLQCTCCTVPTTARRPHGGPLGLARQCPSSQPLSSPQLFHKGSLWALRIPKRHRERYLDYREGKKLSWCTSWSISLWQGWSCGPVHCSVGNKSAGHFPRNLFLHSLKTST